MSRIAIRARLIDIRMIERGPRDFIYKRRVAPVSFPYDEAKAVRLFSPTTNINPCNFNAHDPATKFQ